MTDSDPNDQRTTPTDLDVYGVPYGPGHAEPAHSPTPFSEAPTPLGGPKARSVRRLIRNRGALVAIVFTLGVTLIAIFAPLLAPHNANSQSMTASGLLDTFAPPSWAHPLGTDYLARDELSRLMYGARVSLLVAYSVIAISLIIAVPIGLLSGYIGGAIDNVLMRFTDAGLAFPPLVLALAVAGIMGPGVSHTIFALTIVFLPGFIRFTRGQALGVRQDVFIDASRAIGTRMRRIMYHRVFPNVRSSLTVTVAMSLGGALLAEAGLSFLGLGVQPPSPSWGNMLQDGYTHAIFTHPWQVLIPALAIVLMVFAFNTIGDGIRDALGPAATLPVGRRGRGDRHRHGLTSVLRSEAARREQDDAPDALSDRHLATLPDQISPVGDHPAVAAPPNSSDEPGLDSPLLEIRNLTVQFAAGPTKVTVIEDLNLTVQRGEILGLVGESGCGKTVTSMSIMRLLASPPAEIITGEIRLDGQDLLSLPFQALRRVRGASLAMVFQDPMSSLDPAFTIGNQLTETIRIHSDVSRSEARARAGELLQMVRIPDPHRRMKEYPHQLSGGTRQRVCLAIALANKPKLLIADEPTTALDVTVQAEILELLRSIQTTSKMSMLFVTHDLGVVAEICDRVAVMYAGEIVEEGSVADVFDDPHHPYTKGLLGAMPQYSDDRAQLAVIAGQVPPLQAMPSGCRFHPRCPYALPVCRSEPVQLRGDADRKSRCIRATELSAESSTNVVLRHR